MSTKVQQTHTDGWALKAAARITSASRDKALLAKAQMTRIAKRCGVNRMTITRHLDGDDLRMSEFLATAVEAGFDPVQALSDGIKGEAIAKEAEQ